MPALATLFLRTQLDLTSVIPAAERELAPLGALGTKHGKVLGENLAVGATTQLRGADGRFAKAVDEGIGVQAVKGGERAGGLTGAAFSKGLLASAALTAGIGLFLEKSLVSAGNFQAAMVRLTTSAGETGTATSGNLKLVTAGILAMSGQVGTSVADLSRAMYTIESGSFHGAAGLLVLRAAAEGAKAENADLKLVADAVTSALVDYGYGADKAGMVTTKLVAATAAGKTTFAEMTGSLHSVLPAASAAHISLDDILGDLASMTLHGISADQATQNLTDVIRHMQAPTSTMAGEFALLHIRSQDLTSSLSQNGLSGTLQMIATRIRDMAPAGSTKVILDMGTALRGLTPAVQELGTKLLTGTIGYAEYRKEAGKLDPIARAQAMSFAALAASTHRIGDVQTSAREVMQSYSGALAKATGDATGMNVALMLTGDNAKTTNAAIKAVSGATTEAGNHVAGWGVIQQTFNFRMAAFRSEVGVLAIQIGTALLPVMTKLFTNLTAIIAPMAQWVSQHQSLAATLALSIGGLALFVTSLLAVVKIGTAIVEMVKTIKLVIIAVREWAVVQAILDAEMWANPIGVVILAVAALVAAIVLAIKYHKQIADFVVMVWNHIWEFCSMVVGKIGSFIVNQWNSIYEGTVRVFTTVLNFIINQWNSIMSGTIRIFHQVLDFIIGIWKAVSSSVYTFLKPAIDGFVAVWNFGFAVARTAVQIAWTIIQIIFVGIRFQIGLIVLAARFFADLWSANWRMITGAVSLAWNLIKGWLAEAYNWVAVRLVAGINFWRAVWGVAWDSIKAKLALIWAAITAIFDAVVSYLKIKLGPQINFWRDVWNLAWQTIHNKLSDVWTGIKIIFNAIGTFITQTLPHWFDVGVTAIGKYWAGLKALAAVPVRFVIDTVINKGLIGGLKWVAKGLGIDAKIDNVPMPPGMSEGGYTGNGTKYQPAGIVHAGEYVIPAQVVDKVGVRAFDQLIGKSSAPYPGDGSNGLAVGYADGGLVGTVSALFKDVLSFVTDPVKALTGAMNAVINKIPGGGALRNDLVGAGHKTVDMAGTWLKGKVASLAASLTGGGGGPALTPAEIAAMVASGGNAGAAMSFLRAQIGKPYQWGGMGNPSWDCSGIVNGVWNVIHGRSPYSRTFYTMNEQPYFPLAGAGGILSAGWSNHGESGPGGGPNGVGHTTGVLAGMPFGSEGGIGVHWGSGVTSIGRFAHVGHFADGGLVGRAPVVMDRGGWLPPNSITPVHNGTGSWEKVGDPGGADAAILDALERLINSVDRVGPVVGSAINGTGRSVIQIARAR